jgi:hypothetical protein
MAVLDVLEKVSLACSPDVKPIFPSKKCFPCSQKAYNEFAAECLRNPRIPP